MIDLLHRVQQLFRREQILFRVGRPDIVVFDHSFFIDDDVRPFGQTSGFVVNPEGLHDFAIAIAEQGIDDLGKVGEGFLGKRRIHADTDDFSVFCLEEREVVRTGRLQVLDSSGAEVEDVKVNQDVLAFEAAEL